MVVKIDAERVAVFATKLVRTGTTKDGGGNLFRRHFTHERPTTPMNRPGTSTRTD